MLGVSPQGRAASGGFFKESSFYPVYDEEEKTWYLQETALDEESFQQMRGILLNPYGLGQFRKSGIRSFVEGLSDTGGTLCKAAEALKEHGAKRVFAYATHPILSGKAAENIRNSVIDEVIVTDSIPLSDELKALDKVKVLTLADMLAETIRRISNEESISAMFEH